MLLCNLPAELIIIVGTYLKARDLYRLILVSHRFSDLLLSRLRSLAWQPKHAQTALFWAVLSNNRDLARYVLENADPNIVVGKTGGDQSIVIGFESRSLRPVPRDIDEETLDLIMRQGTSLLLGYKDSPLFWPGQVANGWAIMSGHNALLRLALLKRNKWDGQACFEMLLYAFCRGRHGAACRGEKAIEIILEWACHSLEEKDYRKALDGILLEVIGRDEVSTVQLLLGKGAGANSRDGGVPALLEATRYASPRIAGLLLEHGADISVLDGKEPLLVDFGIGCHSVRVVELLEQNQGKLCLSGSHGDFPQKEVTRKILGIEGIKLLIRIGKTMV